MWLLWHRTWVYEGYINDENFTSLINSKLTAQATTKFSKTMARSNENDYVTDNESDEEFDFLIPERIRMTASMNRILALAPLRTRNRAPLQTLDPNIPITPTGPTMFHPQFSS